MRETLWAALVVALALLPAAADDTSGAVDIVGRNGEFTVKDKSGKSQSVGQKDLRLQKELMPSAQRSKPVDSGEGDATEPAPTKQAAKPKPPATPTVKPETEEEKAIRAADVEALRSMRNQGGAYFYTQDNQPVSFEEIDRRIATGEVEGLKAVGLHLQEWEPLTKAKSTGTPAAESEPAPTPQPVEEKPKY